MFLEKLVEIVLGAWQRVAPFAVVDAWEQGVVLRLGRYHRTIAAGFSWKIPLIEEVIEVRSVLTTLRLPAQTLTSKDGVQLVVAAIIKYRIRDPKPYVTEVWDQVDVLADVTMGAVGRVVREHTAEELLVEPPEGPVATAVRRQVNRYGFEIEAVTFTDLGRVKSLRLIQPAPANLEN